MYQKLWIAAGMDLVITAACIAGMATADSQTEMVATVPVEIAAGGGSAGYRSTNWTTFARIFVASVVIVSDRDPKTGRN